MIMSRRGARPPTVRWWTRSRADCAVLASARLEADRRVGRAPWCVVAVHQRVVAIEQVFHAQTQVPARIERIAGAQVEQGIRVERDPTDVAALAAPGEFGADAGGIAQRSLDHARKFLLRPAQQLRAGIIVAWILHG